MSKYHAKKTTIDGHTFASKREAEQYLLYKAMLQSGEIKRLVLQPTFILQEWFMRDGKRIRAIKYTADFLLVYPGQRQKVVEVKSEATAKARDYVLRKKLFLHKFPWIEFEEVL